MVVVAVVVGAGPYWWRCGCSSGVGLVDLLPGRRLWGSESTQGHCERR